MSLDLATSQGPAVADWLAAAEAALDEVARAALGCAGQRVISRDLSPPPLGGAWVQLLSDREAVLVGLCSDAAGRARLASALVGEEGLSAADVTDALGEIANMLAGGVKRRLVASCPGLQLGLPFFLHGRVEPSERQQWCAAELELALGCSVVLIVLREARK